MQGRVSSGIVSACLTLAALSAAGAQDVVTVHAARRDTVVAATTVTATFAVRNTGADTARVTPEPRVPADWTILVAPGTIVIPPGGSEMVMLSLVVPMRAAAGLYAIRLALPHGAADAVVARVPHRRGLDVVLQERPGYVISGRAYEATFVVRNRGNVASLVRVAARSTMGRAVVEDRLVPLEAEQTRVVRVRVTTPPGVNAATDDVLELSAVHDSAALAPALASARVTVVPQPDRDIEEFQRLPAQLNVRAASSDAVSRFEAFGRGLLRDRGSTEVDFLLRGPTGRFSAFGERDEYRLSVRAPSWRARFGDDVYMLSPLTGVAQPGFGAGLDGTRGVLRAGGYAQQFRRTPAGGSGIGTFVRADADGLRGALNFASRSGGLFPGQVASAAAGVTRSALAADAELARSSASGVSGLARSLRFSGAGGPYTFDGGHQHADTGFSGVQAGASHTYLTANARWFEHVMFAFNGGTHRSDLARGPGSPWIEQLDVATLGATWRNRYTVQLGMVERDATILGLTQSGWQRSVRGRGDHDLEFGTVAVEAEMGLAEDPLQPRRDYSDASLSFRRPMTQGSAGIWVERYSGGSITRGANGTFTVGGDATLRLGHATDLSLMGFTTRFRGPTGSWNSQADVMVSHVLQRGDRIALRARLIGGGTLSAAEQSVAYLEYGMPLRLPISRLRTPGRVNGRVVDAVSGQGVPGALVRLGPQVAITDRTGSVAFGGVPAGEHRLSMSQETSLANVVFVGDPTVVVDSARAQPTTFRLAIARSARVDLTVRRFVSVRGVADSLEDAGPLGNATLVLAGDRDTLYRTTRDDGSAAFTDVPPGTWTISVRGDAPAFHRFEPDRMELTLSPGEARRLEFRLVPRKRDVQIIGAEEELKSEVAPARPATPAPATRTRRPESGPGTGS